MHPKCQQCIATIGAITAFISACPFPHERCQNKAHLEHIHYETHPSPPVENPTMVIASTASAIISPYVIHMGPDPNREGNLIHHIDLTASPTT